MGGAAEGVGFVNAPLTASEVRSFKKEMGNLVKDPVGVSKQVDQFLGPNTYMWGELNSILNILFDSEEVRMIRVAGMKIWERENRAGPPGEQKLPIADPGWDPNQEEGRRNMDEYRALMIRGIKEAVPRGNNTKLAFEGMQEKDETPAAWLNRLKRNIQLYSTIDPESQEGQVLLKVQFVTNSWPDIRRKLEKLEDWQRKNINELLNEALRVYLRREEEKSKAKARVMVAVAKESVKAGGDHAEPSQKAEANKPGPFASKPKRRPILLPWEQEEREQSTFKDNRECYYCGKKGHIKRNCNKLSFDEAIWREQEKLEKILKGDD
ncbi:hypothetical protein HGM15179_020805 [Zosterops borbonicus]|uniref:CCHC-type domain-containing protein n=1 Tax=Zosterops borbonicus TaxID=364589 RepID=A0A8K1D9M9_9PASS|nr:hypothetical protein HGM15179_020805 [Zosterops borbonicus]